MWLPGWLYTALPFIYAGAGFGCLRFIEFRPTAVPSGVLFLAAALVIASQRYAARRDEARRRNRVSARRATHRNIAVRANAQ
jgi:hypothetical protein